jgi:hypothetical protein
VNTIDYHLPSSHRDWNVLKLVNEAACVYMKCFFLCEALKPFQAFLADKMAINLMVYDYKKVVGL